MTSYYRVLRQVTPDDLKAGPKIVKVLELIPPQGRVTFETFRHLGRNVARRGLSHACAVGILKRVVPHERVLELESVRFWITQLNDSGFRNAKSGCSTRIMYMRGLSRLNDWLPGRQFPSYQTVLHDGQIKREGITKSFGNVEELMQYCIESDHGTRTAQRAIREFLADPQIIGLSASMYASVNTAIKSYFSTHDITLDLRKMRKKRAGHESRGDESIMTLEDFYKMMQKGNPGIVMRTIMLVKLQSGMDSGTLADRFSYEGYKQIVKYFKTDDYNLWNLDKCPVPIRVVRVKTDFPYTTFLDRDAISQLREYLAWKEAKHGKHDASQPLFRTKQGTPVYSMWISSSFSAVAVRAGLQEKISHKVFKIRAHEVRDLLKSTLLAAGCKQYAADHVLGHAPRDSYEKQALLYPDELRAEYAKASARINIFSKVEITLNSPDDPEGLKKQIAELKAELNNLHAANKKNTVLEERHKESMRILYGELKSLTDRFDNLQKDRKKAKKKAKKKANNVAARDDGNVAARDDDDKTDAQN